MVKAREGKVESIAAEAGFMYSCNLEKCITILSEGVQFAHMGIS